MSPKKSKGFVAYILFVLFIVLGIWFVVSQFSGKTKTVEYSEIINHFDNYEVQAYTLDLGSGELVLQLRGEDNKIRYNVPNINIFLQDTQDYRKEYNEKYPDKPLKQDYYKINDFDNI